VEVHRSQPYHQRAKLGSAVTIKCFTDSPAVWYRIGKLFNDKTVLNVPIRFVDKYYVYEHVIQNVNKRTLGTYICRYKLGKLGAYVYLHSRATVGNLQSIVNYA